MAAASLAEVYEAEGKDGQRLAVKVQYSDLRERHETDIATVRRQNERFPLLLLLIFVSSCFLMRLVLRLVERFNPKWMLVSFSTARLCFKMIFLSVFYLGLDVRRELNRNETRIFIDFWFCDLGITR